MPFCVYCGNEEPELAAFCSSCGQLIAMPSPTIQSNNLLQQNTVDPIKNDSIHIVNTPELVHYQKPASEIEEDPSATLTMQKAEPHDHSHYEHRWPHWRWRYKYYVASQNSTDMAIKLILIVVLVATVIVGASRFIPHIFHLSSSSPHRSVHRFDAQAAFVPYVGEWARHTTQLVIKADGTGTETEGFGFACDNGTTMCGMDATLRFVSASEGVTGTYTSIGYTDPSYQPTTEDPSVGDSFRLAFVPHDMLSLAWLGKLNHLGTESFCGPKATAPWNYACGV